MPPDPTHAAASDPAATAAEPRLPTMSADDTAAFAASPPSVPPVPVVTSPPPPSLTPSLSPPRKCEGCETPHAGTYGSGRFCSATCAKKVGARHKWAARASALPGATRRPAPARRAPPDAPCESCSRLHDRSYGSGRFCSVHCARRVAATRKWEKSRSEKSKRLEAIRPAMLAPPPAVSVSVPLPTPTPSVSQPTPPRSATLAGKRRRVVDRRFEHLQISDPAGAQQRTAPAPSAFYPTAPPPPSPRVPLGPPHPSVSSPVLSVAPVSASYLPPQPLTPLHYQHAAPAHPSGHAVEVPLMSQVVFASHPAAQQAQSQTPQQQAHQPHPAPVPSAPPPASMFYTHAAIPAYRVVHPSAPGLDTAAFSVMSQSPSPPPPPVAQGPLPPQPAQVHPHMQRHPPQLQYAHMAAEMHRPLQGAYTFSRNPAFEMEALSAGVALGPFEEVAVGPNGVQQRQQQRRRAQLYQQQQQQSHGLGIGMSVAPGHHPGGHPVPEGSESAARALLCLRENNS